MNDEANKLNGSPVKTTFAGATYTFRPLCRAEQRVVRERLAQVVALVAAVETVGAAESMAYSIKATNAILGFCEDHNAAFLDDADKIEAYMQDNSVSASTELIDSVFMPIYRAWLEPWFGGGGKKPNRAARRTKKKTKD